jgi:glycosyltransferase involved in cell wall biosynthesis
MDVDSRPLVIIPAWNEESTVASVVQAARTVVGADVLVVDDGSTDGTGREALEAGATVVTHPYNLGVGGAIRTGMRYALERGYKRVVQMDGDGQHDSEEARRLLEELDRGQWDLVIGARFLAGYEVSKGRRLAMRALSIIVSRRLGTRINDATSGFRAMGPRAIKLFARLYPADYLSDTVEALVLAADERLSVTELDVRMGKRLGGRPSSSSLRSGYHFGRLLLVLVLHGLGHHPSGLEVQVADPP